MYNQKWTELDSLGNWRKFEWANGGENPTWTTQNRTHNGANELTAISGTGADRVDPTFDSAGNMVSGPKCGRATTGPARFCLPCDSTGIPAPFQ